MSKTSLLTSKDKGSVVTTRQTFLASNSILQPAHAQFVTVHKGIRCYLDDQILVLELKNLTMYLLEWEVRDGSVPGKAFLLEAQSKQGTLVLNLLSHYHQLKDC